MVALALLFFNFLFNFYCFPHLFANLQNSAQDHRISQPWGERYREVQRAASAQVGLCCPHSGCGLGLFLQADIAVPLP